MSTNMPVNFMSTKHPCKPWDRHRPRLRSQRLVLRGRQWRWTTAVRPLPPLAKLFPICRRVSAARSRRRPCVPWAVRHTSSWLDWWLWARPFVAPLLVVSSSRFRTRLAPRTGQTLAVGLPRPPFRASWCPLLLWLGHDEAVHSIDDVDNVAALS